MAQIAAKNTLKNISKRKQEIALYANIEKLTGKNLSQQQNVNQLDLEDYINEFTYAKKQQKASGTIIIFLAFFKRLDYIVPLAFQNNITLISDFDGNIINNIYNMSPDYHTKDIHLCVFPLSNSTVVSIFIKQGEKTISQLYPTVKKIRRTRCTVRNLLYYFGIF
ncbi:hypothetical protein AZF37_00565 [endosymbiont 'TC1' of Trimyema compressum]|uniref:hypothetical protein n=1 Tax=endosymbiont 'TC1' of Trimyema compressum TaxID=243899 RepID=UPI0007F0EF1C|nr:hypothetical protein [endosymbiont 'TC1' of Trimyema compressum]AMP19866.1 hypothetical protein AZF37_00565 [endosymbiont 'TC1' of Trimyema compressum]